MGALRGAAMRYQPRPSRDLHFSQAAGRVLVVLSALVVLLPEATGAAGAASGFSASPSRLRQR